MNGDIAYEIHTYNGGKWEIQGFFDDKDLAVSEARRMEESRRYAALRVTEERYDHAAGAYKARTVYRSSMIDEENEKALKERAEVRREVHEDREVRQQTNRETRQRKRYVRVLRSDSLAYALLAAKAIAIFAVGFGAIYALNQLANG